LAKPKRRNSGPAAAMLARQLHLYVSAFVAPTLLFFAATGATQVFRLPDDPTASIVLVKLARLHKDTVFAPRPRRPPRAPGAGRAEAARAKPPTPPRTTLLKWFFVAASIGMIATTLFGLWLAFTASRRRWTAVACLLAGAAIPLVLLTT
jgi:hypothetical protein